MSKASRFIFTGENSEHGHQVSDEVADSYEAMEHEIDLLTRRVAHFEHAYGLFMLYPGLTHTVHGESESGKSLVMQALAAEILNSGGRVLFLDYESDQHSVVSRLRELGAKSEAIIDGFDYRRPEGRPDASMEAWEEILGTGYDLIVIDGVTASLGTFDLSGMSNDDVNKWTRILPRKLAESTGAPLVMVDHVTKSDDGRGRWAIGAQAKMADITGAAYTLEVVKHPKRGGIGNLRLRVGKDRPGFVRPRCAEGSSGNMQVAAEVVVDSTLGKLLVLLKLPEKMAEDGPLTSKGTPRNEDLMERISAEIVRRRDEWLDEDADRAPDAFRFSMDEIEKSVRGKSTTIRDHVKTLANEGYVESTKSRFRFLREYRRPTGLRPLQMVDEVLTEAAQ
ncbi:AAA family ATPase [Williamsia sterculiae]|uniref:AAA domain-containing protein n=1 Tax=Williamsia sterculiae TaxID=1344003 RepID=A0A1N7H3S5_9NOCA|nr:AAA family ATPase [Williamsia sterculiae]SIS19497.1 AAA domain-containing protein [Williamsia sterculiae]